MTKETKEAIRITNVSEPDKDGMITMDIEFLDENFQKRIELYAKNAGMSVEEYIVEALTKYVENLKNEKV